MNELFVLSGVKEGISCNDESVSFSDTMTNIVQMTSMVGRGSMSALAMRLVCRGHCEVSSKS
jgi:hypothetical protein